MEAAHSRRCPVCGAFQDRSGSGDSYTRHDSWRSGGEERHSGRQGALQECRRAAHLPSGQHCGRPPDGNLARHPRRGVAAVSPSACVALSGIWMGRDHAAFRPPSPAVEAGRKGQAVEARRRPTRIPGLPARMARPQDRRSVERIPRERLLPRGSGQLPRTLRLESRYRAGNLLTRRARPGLRHHQMLEEWCQV